MSESTVDQLVIPEFVTNLGLDMKAGSKKSLAKLWELASTSDCEVTRKAAVIVFARNATDNNRTKIQSALRGWVSDSVIGPTAIEEFHRSKASGKKNASAAGKKLAEKLVKPLQPIRPNRQV